MRGAADRSRTPGLVPCPATDPPHDRFHLYALDQPIDIDRLPSGVDELAALVVDQHVLASATLTGTRES